MTPKDIFFSYKKEDKERILPIVRALESQGWSVWWDTKILPGDSFRKTITKALKDARCVVVAWSKLSVISDWVCDEADEGKRENKLVPIRIDDVDIPLGFGEYQAANLIHWNGNVKDEEFQKLIAKISGIVGSTGTVPKSEQATVKPIASTPLILKSVQLNPSSLKPWARPAGSRAIIIAGGVMVDPGALHAMMNGADLYPVGILDVIGNFGVSDKINLYDQNNTLVAEGVTEYASSEVKKIKGKKSSQISQILGIHRSDAVVTNNSISWKKQEQQKLQWKVISSVSASTGIVVDSGAIRAMRTGSNLLPIGVIDVMGQFLVGAKISIFDSNRRRIAQGISEYSSWEIKKIMGKHSSVIMRLLDTYRGDMIVENQSITWM